MYREKVDAWIEDRKEEMLEDLKQLVRINSQRGEASDGKPFGDGPAEAIHAAEALMKKYGFATTNYDNYVVTGDFSDEEKALDILAHLDVVPVTEDWTVTAPFEPKIVDGRIYGRGTADDKGPAIAALYAMRAVKELGIPMKKSVRLILGSDEECGSSDLAYYYSKEKEAPYSFTPDADFPLINVEKGRFEGEFSGDFAKEEVQAYVVSFDSGDKSNVVPARASVVFAGVTEEQVKEAAAAITAQTGVAFAVKVREDGHIQADARGTAAHASTPAEGKNALTASLRLVKKLPLDQTKGICALAGLEAMFPFEDTCGKEVGIAQENEESGALTLCFSILNYTPEHLSGVFDSRLPVGATKANVSLPIKEKLASCGLVLASDELKAPHCVPGDSWFVRTLLDSYERYSGVKGEPLSTGGGTYVHNLERGVAFGCMVPEVDNHMHGDDEFMVIEQLLMSTKIFADAIIKICNE